MDPFTGMLLGAIVQRGVGLGTEALMGGQEVAGLSQPPRPQPNQRILAIQQQLMQQMQASMPQLFGPPGGGV